ncbi:MULTISPECIES: fumarate reductase subunit FrdD [unclassified Anaerobiospirillum]|uniref:fumarate reductase subunit FrdD n=1 Tax=unclassified Anaerobiospirillum TaxID=2647410 RepID=UPI001FF4A3FD|nr:MULTISPECIES: fumarate reductase subunit FrdD [unclassified Anaerobiospirillum]MCK0526231.1 fumarate reductase subunit D [Anaerobiospirillum sp. NML120449]MCK0534968.1 fumarate reductase subunit D [Anaerobiospirillum sp. NML120511]MCK0541121.1 fumarate reductase subunit D [Anaerobiospirillum sp. NML02-A-032]
MQNKPQRSDEPIFWLLFGGGGMAAAMALPAILIVLIAAGLSSPDLTSGLLNFEQARAIMGSWIANLILFTVLGGVFFHALHRLYHSLHDFGIHTTKLHHYVFYGAACALTFGAMFLQLAAYFKA